ncbi:alkaline phosphatase D family protein [Streptomyces sp. NPDC060011]|uniref:alkaline phosphatase D family protein n=1 Tax=unclassified Streptomyces TaxID=2593676 RepID=UPI0022565E02|nr:MULTISPECIES: alkaline phosphatase D family protein [unclassified Streptomyces]MCX5133713.1 alkaline phosphatase D family protein [Streptomyces sp. NBC_00340]MCX5282756.1 alkaline phosphatase D family protein [Streptomyces sp. NBC_00198]WSD80220.1 alkaline phosphatase D family protein [Streptomyces sp. NBC_01558]WSK63788.1 alkaline phosphatase D family protein [Streptomyces sp. NBC_01281]
MTSRQRSSDSAGVLDSRAPSRRSVVKAAAATAVLAAPLAAALPARAATEAPAFLHGVASGDPLPDGVLLWTRVTPESSAVPGSGLGADTEVSWTVATDKAFTTVVAKGSTVATAASDHTVKADIRGLRPATDYWFRFSSGGTDSPAARTRTAPAADAAVPGLRFGVVSCANWEAGYFSAYRHLAARGDLDAWLHLGDYIYEYKSGEYGTRGTVVRPHAPANEIITLADYRTRHGRYKTDPDLQALHHKAPVVAIWDDHEFADNAWSGGAVNHTEGAEGTWSARQSAAKQAYFEWMPVRPAIAGTTYRRLRFGKLADLSLLDLRSFRSQQAATASGSVDDPDRTITGRAQLDWLKTGLKASDTTWRLVGNSVMISPFAVGALSADLLKPLAKLLGLPQEGIALNTDQWDGYTDDRRELLAHLRSNAIRNTVFLTGDIHMAWANDVPVDAGTYPLSASAATEFVVTSMTSDNLDDIVKVPEGTVSALASPVIRAANRHVHWIDTDRHGYGVLDITTARAQMDFYVTSDRTNPNATSSWARSYRTRSGTQTMERTYDPV